MSIGDAIDFVRSRIAQGFVLACVLGVIGCGARIAFVATNEPYAAWDGPVRILHEMPIERAFVELGVLISRGYQAHRWDDVVRALQEKGREQGANAIVLIGREAVFSDNIQIAAIAIRILD
ncbi:MAG: hypothetical protein F4Z57_10290 [Gemmatimonadetes bacterium]|nr:hypothetical protein [Gemmatimonadota bacterium]MYC70308.1 hypothetical protein [Gemmatimonadota bacterium]MYI61065.1 hypothetical protein [Gemmatimonadota bacterium]